MARLFQQLSLSSRRGNTALFNNRSLSQLTGWGMSWCGENCENLLFSLLQCCFLIPNFATDSSPLFQKKQILNTYFSESHYVGTEQTDKFLKFAFLVKDCKWDGWSAREMGKISSWRIACTLSLKNTNLIISIVLIVFIVIIIVIIIKVCLCIVLICR